MTQLQSFECLNNLDSVLAWALCLSQGLLESGSHLGTLSLLSTYPRLSPVSPSLILFLSSFLLSLPFLISHFFSLLLPLPFLLSSLSFPLSFSFLLCLLPFFSLLPLSPPLAPLQFLPFTLALGRGSSCPIIPALCHLTLGPPSQRPWAAGSYPPPLASLLSVPFNLLPRFPAKIIFSCNHPGWLAPSHLNGPLDWPFLRQPRCGT